MAGIRSIFTLASLGALQAMLALTLHAQPRPGRIIYTPDKSPVPYAAIIVGHSAPLYTDDRGRFELDESTPQGDSIIIQAMGCHPYHLTMGEWMRGDGTISIPNEFAQQTTQIFSSGGRGTWLGFLKEYSPWENPSYTPHLGQVLATRVKAYSGQSGTLQRLAFRFVNNRRSSSLVQVRIRLYRYDEEREQPGAEINIGSIFIPEPSGKCEVDLRHLNVPFPAEGLCVGLEWVGDLQDLPASSGGKISVEPSIHITTKSRTSTWELDLRKGWKRAALGPNGDTTPGILFGAEVRL